MAYFPMFIDINNKQCIVIGGGKTALHKVAILLEFGALVTVIAPQILPEIRQVQKIICCERSFREEDLVRAELVVAATNDKQVNHDVSVLCQKHKIPVNVVDEIEDCTFIFPSYIRQQNVVAAFSSSGNSPALTQYLKAREKEILTEQIGELNELLGSLRNTVKEMVPDEQKRRKVFWQLLELGLSKKGSLSRDEMILSIKNYCETAEE